MTDLNDFIRDSSKQDPSASINQGPRQSMMTTNTRSSFKIKQKVDPYALDFASLRQKYVEDTSVKIPFVKSSFVHYSMCPRNMEINGKEYKDLVITMEVI